MSHYDEQRETVSPISGRIITIEDKLVQDLEVMSREDNEAWEFSQSQHEMKVKINNSLEQSNEY